MVSGLGKGHVHPVNHAVVTVVNKSGGVSSAQENSQNAQENLQKSHETKKINTKNNKKILKILKNNIEMTQ